GLIAVVLLLAGGRGALQSATIATALPFSVVMLVLGGARFLGIKSALAQRQVGQGTIAVQAYAAAGLTWQRRLGLILNAPTEEEVADYIARIVRPALESVAQELEKRGRVATVSRDNDGYSVSLTVPASGVRDFVYGVHPVAYRLPAFS